MKILIKRKTYERLQIAKEILGVLAGFVAIYVFYVMSWGVMG